MRPSSIPTLGTPRTFDFTRRPGCGSSHGALPYLLEPRRIWRDSGRGRGAAPPRGGRLTRLQRGKRLACARGRRIQRSGRPRRRLLQHRERRGSDRPFVRDDLAWPRDNLALPGARHGAFATSFAPRERLCSRATGAYSSFHTRSLTAAAAASAAATSTASAVTFAAIGARHIGVLS